MTPIPFIAAIIVTYNRKEALKVCVQSILDQTYKVTKIFIIDNASSDGTPEYLKESGILANTQVSYIRLQKNTGGAGGFHEGIKRAMQEKIDWVWLMDDDVQCTSTALAKLLEVVSKIPDKVGFACSKVLWREGQLNFLNIPGLVSIVNNHIPFNLYDELGTLVIPFCSFASTLIQGVAIREVGLPIADFFIWSDDLEYTERITRHGYLGLYSPQSIVYHRTEQNFGGAISNHIMIAPAAKADRYFYGIRNDLYRLRKRDPLLYVFAVGYYLSLFNFRILFGRKDARFRFIGINLLATLSSLFFYPKIEHL